MCGIFGIVHPRGVGPEAAVAMSQVLRHRGPDDEGFLYCRGQQVEPIAGPDTPDSVFASRAPYAPRAIGAREVRTAETRAGPSTPVDHRSLGRRAPADVVRGRYWMSYNGEVYNYVELREELRGKGYEFHTDSDSEVILAAFAEWGEECLPRFNGMWGIAILDTVTRTLFLARDRFGVKPLYYCSGERGLPSPRRSRRCCLIWTTDHASIARAFWIFSFGTFRITRTRRCSAPCVSFPPEIE